MRILLASLLMAGLLAGCASTSNRTPEERAASARAAMEVLKEATKTAIEIQCMVEPDKCPKVDRERTGQ